MAENIKCPPTMEAFGELIKKATKDDKLIVIFFLAKWSAKCRYMLDIIERRIAGEHDDVDFLVVDVAEMEELQIDWRVAAFPTFTLLKQERVVYRILGPYHEELGEVIGKLKNRIVYHRKKLHDPWAYIGERKCSRPPRVLKR